MRISRLIIMALVAPIMFSPVYANAMHHEPQETASTPGKMPNNEGIVVATIETTGYTYMELENSGKRFWIAAPTTQVKTGDHIRFVESMAMTNFTSKSLDRTFHRLIFVSSTMIKK